MKLLRPGGRLVGYGASRPCKRVRSGQLSTALPQLLSMLRGFSLIKQLQESKAVIGLNMLALWDDRGTLQTVDRPAVEGHLRRRRDARRARGGAVRGSGLRRTRILAARENVGQGSCWCPRRPHGAAN